ncbi:MAG TPA: molybdopterin cofactor-binding domain-containing protein [Steroidobacteraceae bacterium]|jgi:isoquinoline 1-oxidoreductase beta subunit|nr:molybdopterin cofactor-binding domain-containing protein [Steroidobacteraceae bacterium]
MTTTIKPPDAVDPRRRALLQVGVAAAGGLLIGFETARAAPRAVAAATRRANDGVFAPNAFIRIDPHGKITLIMPQVEMGQGVYTSLAMILAEELDAAFDQVVLEAAPPNEKLYANPLFGVQATGNSNSIRAFWMPLRKAAAATRSLLVQAAARTWKVDAASCSTDSSTVIHTASGRKLSYGALAGAAQAGTAPADPPLKSVNQFKLIGKPLKRLDTPDKVNGKAPFGIDALPSGVKFATLAACPVFGGKVGQVDDRAARAIPGVRQVIVLDDLVAVIADHTWAAKRGLAALEIVWNEGEHAKLEQAQIWDQIAAASDATGAVAKSVGDADQGLAQGQKLDAVYRLPFLAHAPMEPMNCTVHVRPDGCEVWVGTQVAARTQAIAAKVCNLPAEKVIVHNHLLGGGFGRRLEVDMTEKAVRVAQHVDGPVKVIWSREEDIQHDIYRPMYYDRLSASLSDGKINGWHHRITGSSVMARWFPPGFQKGVDIDGVDSAIDIPYDLPNLKIEFVRDEPPAVPTGFWRGVGPNNNVFAIESFFDELAAASHKDPVAFRRDLLQGKPRLRSVLDLAASKSGWGTPLAPRAGARVGRGVAVQNAFASFIVTVAEVEVGNDGEVRVRRLVCCVDTGIAVNPDTVIAQLQGGLIFGMTAALYGSITIARGRVQQSNFNDYRMVRMNEAPAIEVHLVDSAEPPGGIGETGTTAAPPALGNAIYAATGIRLRQLPFDREILAGRRKA